MLTLRVRKTHTLIEYEIFKINFYLVTTESLEVEKKTVDFTVSLKVKDLLTNCQLFHNVLLSNLRSNLFIVGNYKDTQNFKFKS